MVAYASMEDVTGNPIDLLEHFASLKEWSFDRRSDEEVAIEAPGQWCDYGLYFAWSENLRALHFSCAFDMRIPDKARSRIYELLAHLNEHLWIGHFSLWMQEGTPMFRHTIQLPERAASLPALEELVDIAVAECERFYPAFQFVVWGGKSAREAIQSSMLDTVGEA